MARRLKPGECFACHCTDEYGCDVGCSWVDDSCTMCSACVALAIAYSKWLALIVARARARPRPPKASGRRRAVRP